MEPNNKNSKQDPNNLVDINQDIEIPKEALKHIDEQAEDVVDFDNVESFDIKNDNSSLDLTREFDKEKGSVEKEDAPVSEEKKVHTTPNLEPKQIPEKKSAPQSQKEDASVMFEINEESKKPKPQRENVYPESKSGLNKFNVMPQGSDEIGEKSEPTIETKEKNAPKIKLEQASEPKPVTKPETQPKSEGNKIKKSTPTELEKNLDIKIEKPSVKKTLRPETKRAQKRNVDGVVLQPLRTYDEDVKKAIQKDDVSTAKIFMAEQRHRDRQKKEEDRVSPTSKTNLAKIMFSIIFVLLGLGAIYYIIFYIQPFTQDNQPTPVVTITPNQFLDREEVVQINTNGETFRNINEELRTEIAQEIQNDDTIKEIVLNQVGNVGLGALDFEEFLKLSVSRVPDKLIRAVEQEFMLGVARSNNVQAPFIIAEVSDLKQTFASLLEWERFMVLDLINVFYQAFEEEILVEKEITTETATSSSETATTTNATSTEIKQILEIQEIEHDPENFADLVINNLDTRAIFSNDQELLFFYSIVNQKYVIFTTERAVFDMLINRINSSSLIR